MGAFDYVYIGDRVFQTKSTDNFMDTHPPYQNYYKVVDGRLFKIHDIMKGEEVTPIRISGPFKITDRDENRDEEYTLWFRNGVIRDCLAHRKTISYPEGLAHEFIKEDDLPPFRNFRSKSPVWDVPEWLLSVCLGYYPSWTLTVCRTGLPDPEYWIQFFEDRITPKVKTEYSLEGVEIKISEE